MNGTCDCCKTAIQSQRARYCVQCVKKHMKGCDNCQDAKGQLLPEYRRQRGRKQLICAACGNGRHVCTLPGMSPAERHPPEPVA
jgi:hypothetical protein